MIGFISFVVTFLLVMNGWLLATRHRRRVVVIEKTKERV